jgi:hypothetical protein
MSVRRAALVFLLAAAVPAAAQQSLAPPPPTPAPAEPSPEGRVFCQQNVSYQVSDRAGVAAAYRRFLGIWSDAAWDPRTCAALIVENVGADGTASIIYVFGPESSSNRVPGGILHGTGIIKNGELRFQNSDGSQFAFRPDGVDLAGHLTTPNGQSYDATFKQSF